MIKINLLPLRYIACLKYPFPAWPWVIVDRFSQDRYPFTRRPDNGRWMMFKNRESAIRNEYYLNNGRVKS